MLINWLRNNVLVSSTNNMYIVLHLALLTFLKISKKFLSYLICSGVPPDVALVIAQAASFLVRNSAFWRISIKTGKIFASITACRGKIDTA